MWLTASSICRSRSSLQRAGHSEDDLGWAASLGSENGLIKSHIPCILSNYCTLPKIIHLATSKIIYIYISTASDLASPRFEQDCAVLTADPYICAAKILWPLFCADLTTSSGAWPGLWMLLAWSIQWSKLLAGEIICLFSLSIIYRLELPHLLSHNIIYLLIFYRWQPHIKPNQKYFKYSENCAIIVISSNILWYAVKIRRLLLKATFSLCRKRAQRCDHVSILPLGPWYR